MLKKFSHLILSILLVIATTGMTISKHYCGNTLVDIQINTQVNTCCDNPNCCHTDTILLQLKTNFLVNATNLSFKTFQIQLFSNQNSTTELFQQFKSLLVKPIISLKLPPPKILTQSILQTFIC